MKRKQRSALLKEGFPLRSLHSELLALHSFSGIKKRPPHLSGVSDCPRYHPACRTRRFCRSEPVTQAKRRSLPAPCTGPFGGAAREPVGTVSRSLRTLSAASSALLQRRWKRTIRFSVKAFGYRNYMIILYSAPRFVNRFLQVLAQHLSAGSVMFFVIRS